MAGRKQLILPQSLAVDSVFLLTLIRGMDILGRSRLLCVKVYNITHTQVGIADGGKYDYWIYKTHIFCKIYQFCVHKYNTCTKPGCLFVFEKCYIRIQTTPHCFYFRWYLYIYRLRECSIVLKIDESTRAQSVLRKQNQTTEQQSMVTGTGVL